MAEVRGTGSLVRNSRVGPGQARATSVWSGAGEGGQGSPDVWEPSCSGVLAPDAWTGGGGWQYCSVDAWCRHGLPLGV